MCPGEAVDCAASAFHLCVATALARRRHVRRRDAAAGRKQTTPERGRDALRLSPPRLDGRVRHDPSPLCVPDDSRSASFSLGNPITGGCNGDSFASAPRERVAGRGALLTAPIAAQDDEDEHRGPTVGRVDSDRMAREGHRHTRAVHRTSRQTLVSRRRPPDSFAAHPALAGPSPGGEEPLLRPSREHRTGNERTC